MNKILCKPTSQLWNINGILAAKQGTRCPWMRQQWIGLCRRLKGKDLARLILQVLQRGGENANQLQKYSNRHSSKVRNWSHYSPSQSNHSYIFLSLSWKRS